MSAHEKEIALMRDIIIFINGCNSDIPEQKNTYKEADREIDRINKEIFEEMHSEEHSESTIISLRKELEYQQSIKDNALSKLMSIKYNCKKNIGVITDRIDKVKKSIEEINSFGSNITTFTHTMDNETKANLNMSGEYIEQYYCMIQCLYKLTEDVDDWGGNDQPKILSKFR